MWALLSQTGDLHCMQAWVGSDLMEVPRAELYNNPGNHGPSTGEILGHSGHRRVRDEHTDGVTHVGAP